LLATNILTDFGDILDIEDDSMLCASRSQWSKLRLIAALRSKIVWLLIGLSSITVAFLTVSCFFWVITLTTIETSTWMWPAGKATNIGILFAAFFVPYIVVPILFSNAWRISYADKNDKIKDSLIRRAVGAWIFIEAVSTKLFIDLISNIFNFNEIDYIFYIAVFGSGVLIALVILVVIRLKVELREDVIK